MARTKQPAQRNRSGPYETSGLSKEARRIISEDSEEEQLEMKEDVADESALATIQPKSKSTSTFPTWARFPLVLLMSLSLSSTMYSFSSQWTAGELASVSRKYEGWTVLTGLLLWRGIELGLGWFGDYDSYDLVSLVTLSHFPPLYLLSAFYNLSNRTAITSLVIDALATYIPFRLLRSVSQAHKTTPTEKGDQMPNQEIISDPYIKGFTIILAAVIYSTTLYASYVSFLPTMLVNYFNDIPTIESAYSSTPISLLPANMLLGLTAYSFIFSPAAALPQGKPTNFDPASATFMQTLLYNLWGWSPRTKKIIKRTAALMSVVGLNSWLQIWATIEGVESTGAMLYSSVWVVASLITGLAYNLVCDV